MAAVWINQLLQGIMLGGLYTLFATGLSLSAGVMRFINIAHGDFIVLTCYILLVLTVSLGVNPVVATLIVLPGRLRVRLWPATASAAARGR
jgi:branched-chain amino acid transport system permease protein